MERTVLIKNLHPDVDIFILSQHFRKYGFILSAKIEHDENFVSLCKGQIYFQNAVSAKEALKMNGFNLLGRNVVVNLPINKLNPTYISKSYTKVFVKNIDCNWDDCDLIKQFEKFGDIIEAQISMTEKKSNGYGFIEFKKHVDAVKAVNEINNKVVGDKVLKVEPYLPKEVRNDLNANSLPHAKDMLKKSVQLNNLHVKNLPKNMDEIELENLFDKFGEIASIKIARNENGDSKRFGFVAFKSEKDADVARFRMNGYSIDSQILEVNFNQGKDQRQHYLQLLKSEPQGTKLNRKPLQGKNARSKISEPIFTFSSKRH